MLDLLRDLWGFASERKKFWLVPLIGTLLIRIRRASETDGYAAKELIHLPL